MEKQLVVIQNQPTESGLCYEDQSKKIPEQVEDRTEIISKLFRRRKNYRVQKLDDFEGPLYIDPYITEKLKKPIKCE